MDGPMMSRRHLVGGAAILAAAPAWAMPAMPSKVVATANGRVRGTVNQAGVSTFKGIPYGGTTAGQNRFMPPTAPTSWRCVRDASEFGPTAPQLFPAPGSYSTSTRNPGPDISEDCLVLNIYTAGPRHGANKAVMVWLHGGGFHLGSASTPGFDGSNLAQVGDVVVVTLNHRLNVFGYQYLGGIGGEDFASSGNAGQLDILQALAWIRDNIEAFGGDPRRVTIFGESGGGEKVTIAMGMPGGQGLFHRAISQSGPAYRGTLIEDQDRAAREVMSELGLASGDMRSLQATPVHRLLQAHKAVVTRDPPPRGGGLHRIFGPTVDGVALPDHPFDPKASPISRDVPLLIGTNHTEAAFFRSREQKLDMRASEVAPGLVHIMGNSVYEAERAYRHYMPTATPWDLLLQLETDYRFGADAQEIALRKTVAGGAPAFLYRFDWESKHDHLRAGHGVDVAFVFSNQQTNRTILGDSPEVDRLAHEMSTAWANFAKTGQPSGTVWGAWPAYREGERATMLISAQTHLENDPDRPLRIAIEKALGRT